MSYTDYSGYPGDCHFILANNELLISFTCPRCEQTQIYPVNPDSILNGIEIECEHPKCRGNGERYGYKLTMNPEWEESVLGLFDRPLHPVIQQQEEE